MARETQTTQTMILGIGDEAGVDTADVTRLVIPAIEKIGITVKVADEIIMRERIAATVGTPTEMSLPDAVILTGRNLAVGEAEVLEGRTLTIPPIATTGGEEMETHRTNEADGKTKLKTMETVGGRPTAPDVDVVAEGIHLQTARIHLTMKTRPQVATALMTNVVNNDEGRM